MTFSTSIAERFVEERQRLALSQQKLANSCGVGKKTVARYEGGENVPGGEMLAAFATLGADINYILTGDKTASAPRFAETSERSEVSKGDLALVPFLDVEASAGAGKVVNSEETRYTVEFDRNWLRREIGVPPEQLRIITACGDSMDSGSGHKRDIHHGDLLIVNIGIRSIDSDSIYTINLGGNLIVKRIQHMMDGGVKIISANPAYETQYLPAGEVDTIHITGCVVYVIAGRKI